MSEHHWGNISVKEVKRMAEEIAQLKQKIKDQEDYIRKLRRMSKGITGQ